jgi:hypothetical protein
VSGSASSRALAYAPSGYGYAPSMSSEGQSAFANGYPAQAVSAVPDAEADAVAAQWRYWTAEDRLDRMVNAFERRFNRSPEVTHARTTERQAWDSYQTARDQALRPLADNPDYQAAVSLKKDLEGQLAEARQARRPDRLRIMALATAKLHYATRATEMERAALHEHAQVQQSQQRLVSANSRLQQLHGQLEQQVYDDAQLAAARDQVEETRNAYMAAKAYAHGVTEARNIALDYANNPYNNTNYAWGHYPPYYANYPSWWLGQ